MRGLGAILVLFLLGILVMATGCAGKGDGEQVANSLFEAVKNKEYEAAMAYYAPAFFEVTPREGWIQTLKTANAQLGDIVSYKLTTWGIAERAATSGSGTYYDLVYEVTYSKLSTKESLSLFRPAGSKQPPVIVGHKIDASGSSRQ